MRKSVLVFSILFILAGFVVSCGEVVDEELENQVASEMTIEDSAPTMDETQQDLLISVEAQQERSASEARDCESKRGTIEDCRLVPHLIPVPEADHEQGEM